MFQHFMYVVECADGTLYTGYAVDVAARVRVHNAGRGAKYTRAHGPVRLLAQARFCTKQRAMSAEAYFKQLDRAQKDRLLALADARPFEDVLAAELPGLAKVPVGEFVSQQLCVAKDPAYAAFMRKLLPSVQPQRVVGVRTPDLRRIAKQLAKRPDVQAFLDAAPHALFEEDQLHSFVIGQLRDFDRALAETERFLPHVGNWATCDQLASKALAQRPDQALAEVRAWVASDHAYTARFGILVLMRHFLDDLFAPDLLDLVAQRTQGQGVPAAASDHYYLHMMRAWFFAECMAKQPRAALPYVLHPECGGNGTLDEWTRKKAIQKAVESRRVSSDLKELLKRQR